MASLVLISWFKEMKSKGLSGIKGLSSSNYDTLKNWLLELLTCTDPAFPTKSSRLPYSELARTYDKMRNEASQLVSVLESCGMHMPMDVENLTPDDAVAFISKLQLPSIDGVASEDSVGRISFDEVESIKQRLLTTSGYLKCVQVCWMCIAAYRFRVYHLYKYSLVFEIFRAICMLLYQP